MHVLLLAIGSHGDVHPFVGIGAALRARGHQVSIVANPHFESLIRREDLRFVPLGTAESYRSLATNPDLWHPTRGFEVVFRLGLQPMLRPMYDIVAAENRPGETVVAGSSLALGARLAQEKLGLPLATVHLAPSVFRSVYQPPVLSGMTLPSWMPRPIQRFLWSAVDLLVIDRLTGGPLNAVRAELGLTPVRGILRDWWHSPQRVIGLFPDWYGPPQPDWPPQTRLTGFPLYDERGFEPLSEDLRRVLDEGEPPIAFTPGSAMWLGKKFFEASAEACRRMGRRGLLLTRHREHLPPSLPPGVVHVEYAPFSELLPRCAALVHHGGIGTTAQALACGVPQLIMPMGHDQFDNGARAVKLGVAKTIRLADYEPAQVADALTALLFSPETGRNAKAVAARFRDNDWLERTCELIEGLAETSTAAPA